MPCRQRWSYSLRTGSNKTGNDYLMQRDNKKALVIDQCFHTHKLDFQYFSYWYALMRSIKSFVASTKADSVPVSPAIWLSMVGDTYTSEPVLRFSISVALGFSESSTSCPRIAKSRWWGVSLMAKTHGVIRLKVRDWLLVMRQFSNASASAGMYSSRFAFGSTRQSPK